MLDDYYDDDYYDEDYEDYDDHVVATPPKKSTATKPTAAKQTTPKKKQVPQLALRLPVKSKAQSQANKRTTFALDDHNKTGPPDSEPTLKIHQNTVSSSTQQLRPVTSASDITMPPSGLDAATVLSYPPSEHSDATSSTSPSQTLFSPATALPPPPAAAAGPTAIPPELLASPTKVPFTLVILGHVDAGKSTVTGHLLYASLLPSSSASKSGGKGNKPPENFAYLCDEDDKERLHGITMDVATKTLSTEKFALVLQDAPGHVDYIPSMITGASHADGALLVVDATDLSTALDHGQLREHVWLMRGMGVSQVLVVVNKMDLVGWSRPVYDDTVDRVNKFLLKVGYSQAKIRFVPVSGLTGANVAKPDPGHLDWYYGGADAEGGPSPDASTASSTLLAALDGFDPPPALATRLGKPLRIVITDVAGEQGRGVSIRGKVVQGWVASGESLSVLPIGDTATLQKLSSLQPSASSSSTRRHAASGEVLDCVLNGVDPTRISVGSVLARPGALPPLAVRCRCKLWVLEGLTIPIVRGTQAIFHLSHLDIPCHVSVLIQVLATKGGGQPRLRPKAVSANSQAEVEIVLSSPVVMEPFSDCRALGRFVLRRSGESIALGRIEQVIQ